jgi:GrpB-like predicted nucleotidyltransferase (UPF0157 family)
MTFANSTPIGVYYPAPAACQPYDPRSPEVAAKVRDLIRSCSPEVEVEHVGSTAIPGCAGKGIIDLMLLYPQGGLESARDSLDRLGFQFQSNRDPFPESRPMRVGAIEHDGRTFRLHVHVLADASPEVAELRAFRDGLRAAPELLAAYVARKRAIVHSGTTDTLDYCNAKAAFIRDVIG